MSFWDTLKPTVRQPSATQVNLVDGQRLALAWDDGKSTEHQARTLRQHCPCAECVDEWSGVRRLEVDQVPADISITEVHPVGNYALGITFGDGHRTGIFRWQLLRELA